MYVIQKLATLEAYRIILFRPYEDVLVWMQNLERVDGDANEIVFVQFIVWR